MGKALQDSTLTDFTDSLRTFTPTVCITTTVTILVLSILVRVHSHVHRFESNISGVWVTVCYILLNPSYKTLNWISKLLLLLISAFVFLFIVLITKNIIRTEQIWMKEFKVYKSRCDIINDINSGVNLTIMFSPESHLTSELNKEPRNELRTRMKYHIDNDHGMISRHYNEIVMYLSQGTE